ncbi:hypothetical protein HW115_10775 [Verrucomicrobiaceae bacterium N1E253]|uniref:DUF3971 domain-containing protein n=1 Tax=Oceaniferula marina TaxID=2748318 RepID=A0A851GPM3_9BACT|nr:hypothetical protein [Oceaniferula marina]NWK56094.1 hypothetical protein [Oceaniferula marina]
MAIDDKRAAFNEQMNEWVSRQGLWFQLRHAADGQTAMSRLARLGLRLIIVLLVASLVFWIYLIRRIGNADFQEGVRAGIETRLHGKDCKIGSIRKDRDIASISMVSIEGTDDSFYHSLRARLVRMNMKLTDGLIGKWNGGGLFVERLDIDLKGGGANDEEAAKAYAALFDGYGQFQFDWLEVNKTNLSWGYSANNKGHIRESRMTAARDEDSWTLEFRGGTFSQNWLSQLTIEKLVVRCDASGVHLKEGVLTSGKGKLRFKLDMGEGGQPEAEGSLVLESMPVKSLLPASYAEWMEGNVSGKGTIGGSTNSQEGIVLNLALSLDDGDVLVLRDNSLPILSALSVVDVYNSYRKISFTEGGCRIRTGGNQLKVSELDFQAGELLHLAGGFLLRMPSYEEVAKVLSIEDVAVVQDVIEKNWRAEDEVLESRDSGVSLNEAAKGVGDVKSTSKNGEKSETLSVQDTAILAENRVRRFDGLVKLGLNEDAFDKSPGLKAAYPFDQESQRIWIDVPLTGRLQTLTLDQAQQMYVLGRNRR